MAQSDNRSHANGTAKTYSSHDVLAQIEKTDFLSRVNSKTPEQSINMYLNQNPLQFERCGENQFRLQTEYFIPNRIPPSIDQDRIEDENEYDYEYEEENEEDGISKKIRTKVYRSLRDTRLVRQLKRVHQDRCQICGTVLVIGEFSYSEGHHIKPLGKDGPDVAGNILILCPNHHVLLDYGAIKLSLDDLRTDTRHVIDSKYIEWHNQNFFDD